MVVCFLMMLFSDNVLPVAWVALAYVVLALIATIMGVKFTLLSVWEINRERYDQHMKDMREIVKEELKKDRSA